MYSSFRLAAKYLNHYVSASNGKGHGVHSPFVFHFIKKVLNDKMQYPAYTQVERERSTLLQDRRLLMVEDFGAGSAFGEKKQRSVQSIVKQAAKPAKYGQLLYRIARYYQPGTLVELGTSLGITSSYLSLACPGARVITLEGSPEIAAVAKENFEKLSLDNIELVTGSFDTQLPALLSRVPVIDLAFIDGNHREEPTVRYFEQLVKNTHNDSILIFDDIHWSPEMETAWERIKSHPTVRCSIDLFFIGILFFRKEFKETVHHSIRF